MLLSNPYLRLTRMHQPVGIWLLFWPCAWSLILASDGVADIKKILLYLGLFFLGSVAMRSAGCIINDIVDRNIDTQVERTKTRPLASGELTLRQAFALLAFLLSVSLLIALELGVLVVMWGALALIPVTIYPFMKRISWWPQLFLGLVFNWGALMGWVALRGQVELPALLLYIGGVCWTLGYDTVYAHQDKEDDKRIGVRSTALRLGEKSQWFVSSMYAMALVCFMLAAGKLSAIVTFIPVLLHFMWQMYVWETGSTQSARRVFFSNAWLGLFVFISLFFNIL